MQNKNKLIYILVFTMRAEVKNTYLLVMINIK